MTNERAWWALFLVLILSNYSMSAKLDRLEKIETYLDTVQAASRGTELQAKWANEKLGAMESSLSTIESNTDR